MNDRWTELYTLFAELADLDRAGREARLAEIGARDRALRDRLEAMLAADDSAETLLHDYAQAAARSILAAPEPRSETDPLGILGTMIGGYRIDGLLGAGGMGVVYRATDVRLGRAVALKFLPPAWSLDAHAKQRFLHEARAASSLDDPNICTVYEAGETADGTLYIAMACYDGATVSDRLARGPLDVRTALDLAAQTASGLAAAHARGLVHRDIKPGNLLVTTEGALKILDFGVAKAADVGLTVPGQRPGTAAYMAPEQARGETLDGRADLWSLGVVLYQMLTGTRPTAPGRVGGRTLPPSALRPGLPHAVDALVLQLLEQDADDRPARAEDVAHALQREARESSVADAAADVAAGAPVGAIPSAGGRRWRRRRHATGAASRAAAYAGIGAVVAIAGIGAFVHLQRDPAAEAVAGAPRFVAVLPFDNASPETANEYFADGVTDDIRTRLSLVPDLSILSRTTAMRYKGSEKSVPEIAEELGVQYVLDGSVRRAAGQVRINAYLLDAATDRQLWAEAYDREIEDIFAVQTEIAQSIVEALETELSGIVVSRIGRRPTADLEAYDLFLRGRASLYRYDLEGTEQSIAGFREALARDPAFTLARAWLSGAFAIYAFNFGGGAAWADSAIAIARQAVAEEPGLADGHTSLGTALLSAGRYEEGAAALERAIELNPNEWAAISNLGMAYGERGQLDDSFRLLHQSLELEARSSLPAYVNLSWYSLLLGHYDRAEAALDRADTLEPGHPSLVNNRAWLDVLRGEHDAALEAAERLAADAAEIPRRGLSAVQLFVRLGELERALAVADVVYARSPTATGLYLAGVLYGYALDRAGQTDRALAVLAEAEQHARERIESGNEANALRYSLACIHALRGELDEAFYWLEEAMRFGWNALELTVSDPVLEDLRDDTRFQLALDRMARDLAAMRERVQQEGW